MMMRHINRLKFRKQAFSKYFFNLTHTYIPAFDIVLPFAQRSFVTQMPREAVPKEKFDSFGSFKADEMEIR